MQLLEARPTILPPNVRQEKSLLILAVANKPQPGCGGVCECCTNLRSVFHWEALSWGAVWGIAIHKDLKESYPGVVALHALERVDRRAAVLVARPASASTKADQAHPAT